MSAIAVGQNKAKGLPQELILAKGCTVLLKRNLWDNAGLCNGSKGTVKNIIYEENQKPPELPLCVIVSFEKYKGPWFMGLERCFPIIPESSQWYEGTKLVTRTMLPLILGYAVSIHNSQGMTIESVIPFQWRLMWQWNNNQIGYLLS